MRGSGSRDEGGHLRDQPQRQGLPCGLFVCEELCLLIFYILPSCHQPEAILLLSLVWPSQTNENFFFLNHRLWELEGTLKFTRCDLLQK